MISAISHMLPHIIINKQRDEMVTDNDIGKSGNNMNKEARIPELKREKLQVLVKV